MGIVIPLDPERPRRIAAAVQSIVDDSLFGMVEQIGRLIDDGRATPEEIEAALGSHPELVDAWRHALDL